MKTTAIATTIICAIFLGGVLTSCNQTSPPESTQTSSAPPVVSTTPQASSAPMTAPENIHKEKGSTTPEQEQKREERRKQIEAILTPDQVQQLQTKLKQGVKMHDAISSLDLTTDQKAKMQSVMEKSYDHRPNSSENKSSQ